MAKSVSRGIRCIHGPTGVTVGEGVIVGVGAVVLVGIGVWVAGTAVGVSGGGVAEGMVVGEMAVVLAATSSISGTTTTAAGWQLDKNNTTIHKSKKLQGGNVAK